MLMRLIRLPAALPISLPGDPLLDQLRAQFSYDKDAIEASKDTVNRQHQGELHCL